ncbi:MAG TPA: UDP-2,3-diacylglucosamine diphosphatase [Methanomassiliicoccales archaeon]|nr:UDP-2,3-diacylglucosamine diphosphatase [Methanomassiliicoccales archaeon]
MMERKKVVVISDTHLGYEKCDRASLNDFLSALQKDPDVTDLVLLGDIVDMWRRDASGVFLESREIVEKIIRLQERTRVHYVAGNHDYHLLHLKNTKQFFMYPLEFKENLTIEDGQYAYRFMHGYEFEYGPREANPTMHLVMNALCRVMSDEQGYVEDDVWGLVTKGWSEISYFFSTILLFRKRRIKAITTQLRDNPEKRLTDKIQDVDRRAYEAQGGKPNEILVYGHTHRPFINKQENVVNSGSWVTDATTHNTYLELSEGRPRLFVFGKGEILERVDLPR